jgi:hypothetical protein
MRFFKTKGTGLINLEQIVRITETDHGKHSVMFSDTTSFQTFDEDESARLLDAIKRFLVLE